MSNKDSEERGDPLEAVLYGVFVATSARASVAELAEMLSVDLPKLQAAISVACRLGFATNLSAEGHQGAAAHLAHATASLGIRCLQEAGFLC